MMIWFVVRSDVKQNKDNLHGLHVTDDTRRHSYSCKIHPGEATLAVTDGRRKLALPITTRPSALSSFHSKFGQTFAFKALR